MKGTVIVIFFICLIMSAWAQSTDSQPCFDFKGDSYLQFSPNNFDNNNQIHYSFKFRTTQANGILMYARGIEGDDEALFIRNGKLHYHLFNTSPTGVEGYFGALVEGDEFVNTGSWITVDVYRSWNYYDNQHRRQRQKTGFKVIIDGDEYIHYDYLDRSDISIQPDVFFGGFREPLSSTLQPYNGQMKDIYEEKNAYSFQNPSLNYRSKVALVCLPDSVMPN